MSALRQERNHKSAHVRTVPSAEVKNEFLSQSQDCIVVATVIGQVIDRKGANKQANGYEPEPHVLLDPLVLSASPTSSVGNHHIIRA